MKVFPPIVLPMLLLAVATHGVCSTDVPLDSCGEAGTIAATLGRLTGDELVKQEGRVLELCPEGTPGQLVKAMRRERSAYLQKQVEAEMAAGHDEQALNTCRQLLAIDGTNGRMRYTLGLLYERQGQLAQAQDQFRQAVAIDARNREARRHLADIYTLQGNFPLAIQEYLTLIAGCDDNPLLHFKLARAYARSNKYREAIAEYRETAKLAPDNAEVHKELAELYLKKGLGNEAAGQYREVLRLDREDVSTRNTLINIYVKLKKYDDLFTLIKEGAERAPNDPDSHFRLGLMYDFRKEFDNAIAEYQKALALKSDHAKSLKGLGKVYLETGNLEQARICLEAAQKADPRLFASSELLDNLRIEQVRASVPKVRWHPRHKKKSAKHIKGKKTRKSVKKTAKGRKKSAGAKGRSTKKKAKAAKSGKKKH